MSNVTDTFSQTLPPANVSIAVLLGDSTGNNAITSSDVAQTKVNWGATASQTNLRSDFNLSGTISSTDVGIVKAASGSAGGSLPLHGKPSTN